MATKCIVIGEDEITLCDPNPIELKLFLSNDNSIMPSVDKASSYQNIELLHRGGTGAYKMDLMLAYDENRELGLRFFGHWNDGIV